MFLKRKLWTKYPAYVGHTVYQSEYDALKAECDRAHARNVELQKLEQKYDKLRASYDILEELYSKLDRQLQEEQYKAEEILAENERVRRVIAKLQEEKRHKD